MKTPVLLLCLVALATNASAQSVTITSASRSLETMTFGYNWDFNNGVVDTAAIATTSGTFADIVFVDLYDWYGGHVGTGNGTLTSDLSAASIAARWDLYASCLDTGVYQADCTASGDLAVAFEVSQRVRAQIRFEAFCYDDSSWALTELGRVGSPGSILALQIFGDDDGGMDRTTWLQAGNYTCTAEADCWAFGTYGTDDDATAVLDVSVHFYHEADFSPDGWIDDADRAGFLAAYDAGSLEADFNGDGACTASDRSQFLASWHAGRNRPTRSRNSALY